MAPTSLHRQLLHRLTTLFTLLRILRQKHDPGRIVSWLGQSQPELLARYSLQERVRQSSQHARAVTRVGFTTTRPAMVHISQDRRRILDDLMAALALDMSHKADTTVLMLELRIIKPMSFRSPERRTVGCRVLVAADIFHRTKPWFHF